MTLDALVATFAADHPECQEGALIEDCCLDYSHAFVHYLGINDIDAEVVVGFRMGHVSDLLAAFTGGAPRPKAGKPNVVLAGHAAVRVGDAVYDWTLRQFYPDALVPTITPYAEWRADWSLG